MHTFQTDQPASGTIPTYSRSTFPSAHLRDTSAASSIRFRAPRASNQSPSLAASASYLSLGTTPFPLPLPIDSEALPPLEFINGDIVLFATPPFISASASSAPTPLSHALVVSTDKMRMTLLHMHVLADTPNAHAPLHSWLCGAANFAHDRESIRTTICTLNSTSCMLRKEAGRAVNARIRRAKVDHRGAAVRRGSTTEGPG